MWLLLLVACPSKPGPQPTAPAPPPEETVPEAFAPPPVERGFLGFCDRGTPPTAPVDADGDGVSCETDCDDQNPTVYPDAPTICWDGLANTCGTQLEEPCPNGRAFPERAGAVVGDVFSGGDFWGTPGFVIGDGNGAVQFVTRPVAGVILDDPDAPSADARPLGDVTGDGIGDVYDLVPESAPLQAGIWPRPHDASSYIDLWTLPACGGDVDGDGLGDIWIRGGQATDDAVLLFTDLQPGMTPTEEEAYGSYGYLPADPAHYDMYWTAIRLADLTGDGMSELIYYQRWYAPGADPPIQAVGLVPSPLDQVANMDASAPYSTLFNPDVVETWVQGLSISAQVPISIDVDDDGRLDLLTIGTLNRPGSDHGPLVHPVDLDGHFIPGGGYQLWSDRDLRQIETCGDVDGDGRDDILAMTSFAEAGTTLAVYPNPHVGMERGDVLFGMGQLGFGAGVSPWCVDVDQDGDVEIGADISWYEGGSTEGFATVLYPGGL